MYVHRSFFFPALCIFIFIISCLFLCLFLCIRKCFILIRLSVSIPNFVLPRNKKILYYDCTNFYFEIVFKSLPSGETPPVEDNEVSLARIAANRASSTVTSGDIVRDVTASYGINSGVSNGAFTNIDGLIKGDQNKISRAIPGTDYMPVSGGTFTGDISKSGVIYQTIRRQKTGAPTNANGQWTTEIYQDGFCRMYCHIFKTGCTLKSQGGTSFYIVETGTSPSPGYLYVPFPDNIVLSYGAMATVSTAFGSFANIYALPTPVLLTDGSDSISCYARAIVAASGTPEPSIYNINVDFYISIAGWME